ncbi:MAG TPA: glycosyl hydrolase family 65 protein, partial [bacterium]|nr:glycosyl hydrolase family 65 protein [bacterium]
YNIIHGFGYTISESFVNDIKGVLKFFVPQDSNREIWRGELINRSSRKRNLEIYSYVEFSLGHALVDLINQCDDQHFNRVNFDRELNTLFATKTYWVTENFGTQQQENQAWNQYVFFNSSLPIKEYETRRERFIGFYRNENNPVAIEKGHLSSRDTDYGNAIGVLKSEVTLQPGQTKGFIYNLGVIPKEKFNQIKESEVGKFLETDSVDKALRQVKDSWEKFFSKTNVKTPESDLNIFMNYWIPYQAKVAFDVGRVASYYYWGIGRGFGFRDTAQDTLATTIANPKKARQRIALLSRQMFTNGKVYHHFYKDGQGETTQHCDDPLWFILAVTDYLKETGDFDFLKTVEPFLDESKGTILDHILAVVDYIKDNKGPNGLPIFGRGDWNDTLDYIGGNGGGESVWGALFFIAMLNELIGLLEFIDNKHLAEVKNVRDQLKKNVQKCCWDGEWFIRAIGNSGKKIGSKSNKYGKIYLNSQAWAVISKVADRNKLIKALDSVKKHLDSEFGPKICSPAYQEIDQNIGLVTRCVPGKKENAGVFCHPTTWLIQAECMLGRGNRAYQYFKNMLPNRIDSDTFTAEPYVYSQYITSDANKEPGKASHSWQTGTAVWMYRVSIDYILGVRAQYSGLKIDPAIPAKWDKLNFDRYFRGTLYKIRIKNPESVQKGVKEIYVDDHKIEGNILPVLDNKEAEVKVIMG